MDINKLFQSKIIKKAFLVVVVFVILLLVFKVGVFVGYKKAQYSYRWGENYHKNFAGPHGGFFGNFKHGFGDRDFINAHGTFGSIIRIDVSVNSEQTTLIIKGKNDVERTILISDKTEIDDRRERIKVADLKVDDQVVVIGSPNEQGQIEAKLIRIIPRKSLSH